MKKTRVICTICVCTVLFLCVQCYLVVFVCTQCYLCVYSAFCVYTAIYVVIFRFISHIYFKKRSLCRKQRTFLACICVFFIFVWFILALYIRYSLVKAIFFRNCVIDEGGGWLYILLHLFYLRGFINRVLSSCGLYKTQSVELICFYLGCGDAET